MKIKELNEAIDKVLCEEEESKSERDILDDKLYQIVPYDLCRTKDVALLTELYAYFDSKYKVAWQGGMRRDERGMLLCYWIDRDNPNELCLYLTSDHDNIVFSGSTHWAVPAKSFDDKVAVIKQIKQDVDNIVANIDKRPKVLYGDTWRKYGTQMMCSLYLSKENGGNAGSIFINYPSKEQPQCYARIHTVYYEDSIIGNPETIIDELKEKVKSELTLNLQDASKAKVESFDVFSSNLQRLKFNESLNSEKKVLKEAVTNKKGLNEDVNTVYVLINNKVALNFEQDFDMAIDVLDAEGLKKRAEELDKNFEQNAKEANLGSPLMSDVLYAIKVLRDSHYFVLIRNVH